MLAQALKAIDNSQIIFYANGISDSTLQEIPGYNFEQHELHQLINAYPNCRLVYFSTVQCSSEVNHKRPYVRHKLNMEEWIISKSASYQIFRASNLVGSNPWNTHTLFNFLHTALFAGTEVHVNRNVVRNVLDIDDFTLMVNNFLHNNNSNGIAEIVNPVSYTMGEILTAFEDVFRKKFNICIQNEGYALFNISPGISGKLASEAGIDQENYLHRVITKYYTEI